MTQKINITPLLKMEKQKAEASGQEWSDVIILRYTQESSADIIERQCVNTGKLSVESNEIVKTHFWLMNKTCYFQ